MSVALPTQLTAQRGQTAFCSTNGLNAKMAVFFASLVGYYQPNPFGLFDILGNAQEWVQDCYVNTYERAPNDGRAENSSAHCSRVLRGGGWGTTVSHLRIAKRDFNSANFRVSGTGFRIARSLAPR